MDEAKQNYCVPACQLYPAKYIFATISNTGSDICAIRIGVATCGDSGKVARAPRTALASDLMRSIRAGAAN